jgi:LuxR family maltose regulon positive regulatory protein
LARAEQQAKQVLAIGEQVGYIDLQSRAEMLLARIECVQGRTEAAQQRLHALLAQPAQPRWLTLVRRARAEQARIAISAGDLAATEQWAATLPDEKDEIDELQQEQEAFLLARLWIAQGKIDAALALLAERKNHARQRGRTRHLAEILTIESLAHNAANRLQQAHEALLAALHLVQPGGTIRLFVDEGVQLAHLLESLLPSVNDEAMRSYLQSLLAAFAAECEGRKRSRPVAPSRPRFTTEPAVETLSEREGDVLRLVAAGLATEEIARELIISVGTVRTHLKNIYGKLDAHSRVQAVERARDLNYL